MLQEIPNNEYFIAYSNHFIFDGILLSFRKKELFDISNIPKHIPFNEKANCWLVNRKHLSKLKAEELIKKEEFIIDVSELQWHKQIELDHVFNLSNN